MYFLIYNIIKTQSAYKITFIESKVINLIMIMIYLTIIITNMYFGCIYCSDNYYLILS